MYICTPNTHVCMTFPHDMSFTWRSQSLDPPTASVTSQAVQVFEGFELMWLLGKHQYAPWCWFDGGLMVINGDLMGFKGDLW